MNKQELLKQTEQLLINNSLDPKLAKYIYEGLFNNDNLDDIDLKLYQEKINCIINGISPQYVLGKVNFYGYDFNVNNNVLIPRFETEELVYNTIEYIKKYFDNNTSVVDIGTGSGAIAITLKKELPNLDVYATDISNEAITVAKDNAKVLNADIKFLVGTMLEPLGNTKFDVIISNPPYLRKTDAIDKIVIDNEPHIALFGGEDGLKYYKEILKSAKNYLNDRSMICFEISEEIKQDLEIIVKEYFPHSKYEFKKDMSLRTRMLFIFNNID